MKPNIVFIFCDDLGWGDISCLNPASKISTPNIDKLAKEGICFIDAHTGSAVCTPSRYTLLTGRYCWRTKELKQGVNSGFSPALIKKERHTIASALQSEGYNTSCFGKWHIGMDWATKDGATLKQDLADSVNNNDDSQVDFSQPIKNGPTDVGFDYFYGIAASLDMTPYVWIENDRVTEIPTAIIPGGKAEKRAREGIGVKGWRHEDVLPTLAKKAKEHIKKQAQSNTPFFLYMPVAGPHTPVVPNKEWIGKSECGIYGDFVMEIDDVVGQIVKTIDDLGIRDNTMICFSSDNGPETITLPYREKYGHYSTWKFRDFKRDNWEGGHRVPYIISWPDSIKKDTISKSFIELADFSATVCDIVGYSIADDFCEDSYSMLPILQGKAQYNYRDFMIHHSCGGYWAIRKGKWKMHK